MVSARRALPLPATLFGSVRWRARPNVSVVIHRAESWCYHSHGQGLSVRTREEPVLFPFLKIFFFFYLTLATFRIFWVPEAH